MARYDVENLLDGVVNIIKANLNTKITALNTEKNDGIQLMPVEDAAYFFMGLNERVANFNPFIIYGVESLATLPIEQGSALDIGVSVVVVVVDQGKPEINRLMLRYSRALKEVIEENNQKAGRSIKLTVEQFMPISFELLDSDAKYKAIGITINGTIP